MNLTAEQKQLVRLNITFYASPARNPEFSRNALTLLDCRQTGHPACENNLTPAVSKGSSLEDPVESQANLE